MQIILQILFLFGIVSLINRAIKKGSSKRESKRLLSDLEKEDQIWNHKKIIEKSESVFWAFEEAKRSFTLIDVKDLLTSDCYDIELEIIESDIKNNKDYPFFEAQKFTIIRVGDFLDDKRDEYDVEFSGNKNGKNDVTELWTFRRVENNWLLDDINRDDWYKIEDSVFHKK